MVNIQVSKAPFSLGEINCGPRKLAWLAYIMPMQVGQVSAFSLYDINFGP